MADERMVRMAVHTGLVPGFKSFGISMAQAVDAVTRFGNAVRRIRAEEMRAEGVPFEEALDRLLGVRERFTHLR